MTKIIEIEGCGDCPWCSGWDPDMCYGTIWWQKEKVFCAHERMTNHTGKDRDIAGCLLRNEYKQGLHDNREGVKQIPIPEWCPLEDKGDTEIEKGLTETKSKGE